jgi:hypothetical protein
LARATFVVVLVVDATVVVVVAVVGDVSRDVGGVVEAAVD